MKYNEYITLLNRYSMNILINQKQDIYYSTCGSFLSDKIQSNEPPSTIKVKFTPDNHAVSRTFPTITRSRYMIVLDSGNATGLQIFITFSVLLSCEPTAPCCSMLPCQSRLKPPFQSQMVTLGTGLIHD